MTSPSTIDPTPAGAAGPGGQRLFGDGRARACLGAVALISLIAFEALAVAAAMPAVAAGLGGTGAYALAFGGPIAASVVGMVYAGRSSDRRGAAHATVWGLVLFTAGLLVAGLSSSMTQLVAGRLVQGLGGGMLSVALYAGMGRLVPKALHPRLFSLFATAWVVPGLVGPAIAVWLVGQFGWRLVFLVAAAIAPLAAALLLPALSRGGAPSSPPDDDDDGGGARPLAWALVGAAGALLVHAAGSHAEPAATATAMLVLGLLLIVIAALRLLPAGALRAARGLPAVIVARALLAASFATAEAFVPLALTRIQGWPLSQAGLALTAGAIFWSAGSGVQARIHSAERRRQALAAGFLLQAAGIGALCAMLGSGLPPAAIVAAWSVAGFGIGLSFPMLSVLTLALSDPAEQGRNASALQLGDALGTSAAIALAGVAYTAAGGAASRDAYVAVLSLAAALAVVGAGASLRIGRS